MDEKNQNINNEINNQNKENNNAIDKQQEIEKPLAEETKKVKEEIGKVVKVFTNELTFGKNDRLVNIFGLFKYKKNNTNYVVYADVVNEYNIIYYATAHIKENNILTLDAKKEEDANAIKEYIFKLTSGESLNDYEPLSLDNIETIEIIGFSKIDVKPEILSSLIELTIPKKEEKTSSKTNKIKKKKSSLKTVLLILIIACLGGGAYLYFTNLPDPNAISKNIVCKTNYEHDELEATVYEEKTFNFNNQDTLKSIDNLNSYLFNTTDDYLDFVNRGLYYKYMPDDNTEGGYNLDNNTNTYKVTIKETIDETYTEATAYEEVLSVYKSKGYSCTESINE